MKMKDVFFEKGRENARILRAAAKDMSGTEIIDRERDAPQFEPDKDYSGFPVGSPVRDRGQVWLLLQPHHAAHFDGRPETLRALWGVAHTTDPKKAKTWIAPLGTSGIYVKGECYRGAGGAIYRCRAESTVHPAEEYADAWERVTA